MQAAAEPGGLYPLQERAGERQRERRPNADAGGTGSPEGRWHPALVSHG